MRKKLVVPLVVAASLLGVGISGVVPVGALSCAAHPDGSPEAIASGNERLSLGGNFFDSYDFAVIGTVVEIHTVEAGEADHGATTLSLEVVAVLGEGAADRRIEISSPDPGWMAGHPYQEGATYFIPVQRTALEGQPNLSHLCDPITQVDVAIASELGRLAADAGIPFATPDVDPVPVRPGEAGDEGAAVVASSARTMPTAMWPLAVVAIVGAAVLAAPALRQRARAARS